VDANYNKIYAYQLIRKGERIGSTEYADTLEVIHEANARPGYYVSDVEEGFFAYEPENGNRKAWRSRGPVQRRKWERSNPAG
jgi:hypothetical protein